MILTPLLFGSVVVLKRYEDLICENPKARTTSDKTKWGFNLMTQYSPKTKLMANKKGTVKLNTDSNENVFGGKNGRT